MKVTIADIAEKANVSKMTVSRVLSGKGQVAEKTADKVNQIINELGYQPNLIARSLASNRSMNIGVVIPKIEKMFLDNYIAQILSGITDVAQENNYRIMLCPTDPNSDKSSDYINIMRSKLFDGLVLVKTKLNDPNINMLVESEFPFVLVNYKKYSNKINFVDSKNIDGAKSAVQYLFDKGHRKIAFVSGSLDESNGKDRLKGYTDKMNELELPIREDWIVYGDFNKEKAYDEAKKLLQSPELPTAIFCADDYMAIGVMERIKAEGYSIPKDFSVIGFDDIEIAPYVKPALTTIRQSIYELGKTSARTLLELISGERNKGIHKLLNVELIERESC